MKNIRIVGVLFICLLFFCQPVSAAETLLDNSLDLKTDRLNKKQTQNENAQSFIAEDKLFQAEMSEKLDKAKEIEAEQQAQEKDELFLTEVPKTKETDPSELFTATESKQTATTKEAGKTASSPVALYPLIIGLLVITIVTLVIYYSRRRGKQHGRQSRTH